MQQIKKVYLSYVLHIIISILEKRVTIILENFGGNRREKKKTVNKYTTIYVCMGVCIYIYICIVLLHTRNIRFVEGSGGWGREREKTEK